MASATGRIRRIAVNQAPINIVPLHEIDCRAVLDHHLHEPAVHLTQPLDGPEPRIDLRVPVAAGATFW